MCSVGVYQGMAAMKVDNLADVVGCHRILGHVLHFRKVYAELLRALCMCLFLLINASYSMQ